jgi:GPH family glycoside/pentoside/hexuronide:cation symporter
LHPIIVAQFDDPQMGYMVSAAFWAVVVTVPSFIVVAATRERPESMEPDGAPRIPILIQLKIVFSNRPYRFVIGLYLLSWLALQMVATVLIYYVTYYMGIGDQLPMVLLALQGSTMIFLFVWSAVSRRLDKRIVYMIGASIWLTMQLALYFLTPDMVAYVIPLALIAGAGVAVAYLIPWAMMPDVIEFDELETGQRREGIFYGFMVFLQKVGLALGIWMVGLALSWSGYVTPTDTVLVPTQPESALMAIRILTGPIPAVVLFASLFVAYFYPITRERHEQVREALAARKAAQGELPAPTELPPIIAA